MVAGLVVMHLVCPCSFDKNYEDLVTTFTQVCWYLTIITTNVIYVETARPDRQALACGTNTTFIGGSKWLRLQSMAYVSQSCPGIDVSKANRNAYSLNLDLHYIKVV